MKVNWESSIYSSVLFLPLVCCLVSPASLSDDDDTSMAYCRWRGRSWDFTTHFSYIAMLLHVFFFDVFEYNSLHVLWETSLDSCADTHLCPGGHYFGNSRLSVSLRVCVYVCLSAWLACQDIWLHPSPMEDYRKWQIKGLSLAAWQRTENYSRNRRCVCGCLNPPRGRLIPLAIKPITSVIPQNCAVFDAGCWRCCCFHCPAGRMTMSLWYFLVEGKRVVEEDVGGERG